MIPTNKLNEKLQNDAEKKQKPNLEMIRAQNDNQLKANNIYDTVFSRPFQAHTCIVCETEIWYVIAMQCNCNRIITQWIQWNAINQNHLSYCFSNVIQWTTTLDDIYVKYLQKKTKKSTLTDLLIGPPNIDGGTAACKICHEMDFKSFLYMREFLRNCKRLWLVLLWVTRNGMFASERVTESQRVILWNSLMKNNWIHHIFDRIILMLLTFINKYKIIKKQKTFVKLWVNQIYIIKTYIFNAKSYLFVYRLFFLQFTASLFSSDYYTFNGFCRFFQLIQIILAR